MRSIDDVGHRLHRHGGMPRHALECYSRHREATSTSSPRRSVPPPPCRIVTQSRLDLNVKFSVLIGYCGDPRPDCQESARLRIALTTAHETRGHRTELP